MNTLIVIGVTAFIIILISRINDNKAFEKKQKDEFEKVRNAENIILNKHKESLFEYGKKTGKIGRIIYDIEEGGRYHTEYNPDDINRVSSLIAELIEKYRFELISDLNTGIILNKMKKEIDKLKKGVDASYGFDDEDYY